MKYIINITQKHIDVAIQKRMGPDGYRGSCDCPIASALREQYPGAKVLGTQCFINQISTSHTKRMKKFIYHFDRFDVVEPTTFTFYTRKEE